MTVQIATPTYNDRDSRRITPSLVDFESRNQVLAELESIQDRLLDDLDRLQAQLDGVLAEWIVPKSSEPKP